MFRTRERGGRSTIAPFSYSGASFVEQFVRSFMDSCSGRSVPGVVCVEPFHACRSCRRLRILLSNIRSDFMKRTYVLPILTILAVAVAAVAALSIVTGLHPVAALHPTKPEDDPAERAEWEVLRLRDPATGRIPDGIRRRELAYAAGLPSRESRAAYYRSAGIASYSWTSRGPYNVGGRTRALALDVTGEDTILAGGISGGMWRSTNGGASWTKSTSPEQLQSASCVVQDVRPGNTNIWYYGTGELIGNSAGTYGAGYLGDGIFKSTDNGRSWQPLPSTVTGTPNVSDNPAELVWNLAVDPSRSDSDVVYAAVYYGILRSADGGATWTMVLSDFTGGGMINDVAVTPDGTVYAALSGGGGASSLWRSADGIGWTKITPPEWPQMCTRAVIAVAPSDPNQVYFLAHTPGYGHKGVNWEGSSIWASLWHYRYVSGDGSGNGGLWEDRSANIPGFGGSFGDFDPQFSYDLCIGVKSDDPNTVYIGGTNVYRSTDGFTTSTHNAWIGGYLDVDYELPDPIDKVYSYPNHHPDIHRIIASRHDPRVVYTGSDGGVHRTLDGLADSVRWESLNHGYLTTQFYTVAIDHSTSGNSTVIGGLQDQSTWLSTSDDPKADWVQVGGDYDGSYCAIVDGGRSVYLSVQLGWTYRARVLESGGVADYARLDPDGDGLNYWFVNPFAVDPSDEKMMFMVGGDYLWRNSDVSAAPVAGNVPTKLNWSRLNNSKGAGGRISAVGVSTNAPSHRLYYGTQAGAVYRLDGADVGDPVPVDVSTTEFPSNAYVSCLAVDPNDGDHALVVFSNYNVRSLFVTTDGGGTWTAVGGNLEEHPDGSGVGPSCRWARIVPRGNRSLYFVGTSTGLYSTEELVGNETVWAQEGASTIGNVVVDMIDARASDGFVVAATHGNGVYSTYLPTLGVDAESEAHSDRIALEQNVPNPVTERTTIAFTLPSASSDVRVTLFDASSRRVAVLFRGPLTAGRHTVEFDPGKYPTSIIPDGAYFYRVESGRWSSARKMIVER